MVLLLGEHDAFAGDDLGLRRIAGAERRFHRRDERGAHVLHDFAAGRLLLRIQLHLRAHVL